MPPRRRGAANKRNRDDGRQRRCRTRAAYLPPATRRMCTSGNEREDAADTRERSGRQRRRCIQAGALVCVCVNVRPTLAAPPPPHTPHTHLTHTCVTAVEPATSSSAVFLFCFSLLWYVTCLSFWRPRSPAHEVRLVYMNRLLARPRASPTNTSDNNNSNRHPENVAPGARHVGRRGCGGTGQTQRTAHSGAVVRRRERGATKGTCVCV